MAAALFRHAIDAQEEPLRSLGVTSAGVSAFPGQAASINSIDALKKVNIDLESHRSQAITQEIVDDALAFFCMTDSHLAMLNYHIDPPPANAFLMRQFIGAGIDDQIPDPFGGNFLQYEACRDSMVEAVPSLIEVVKKLLGAADSIR